MFCICFTHCIHFLYFLTLKFPIDRYIHSICYVTNDCFSGLFTEQGWKDRKEEKQEMEREEERAKKTNGKESTEERERDESGEGKGRREVTEGKKHGTEQKERGERKELRS